MLSVPARQLSAFSSQLSLSAFSFQRLSLDGILEDCSGYEEDEAGNGSNYSDEMKRRPAIAKLFQFSGTLQPSRNRFV